MGSSPWGHKKLDMIEHTHTPVIHIKIHVKFAFGWK